MKRTDVTPEIENTYALSPMQRGILFHSIVAPESGIYMPQVIGTLHESLDVAAFKQAWQRVISRHEVMRTGFRWEGLEEPVQDVYRHADLPFEILDWQSLSDDEKQSGLQRFLAIDRKRGFNLKEAPLVRLTLIQLGTDNYHFIWTYHHIISSARFHPVILNEVFLVYEALCHEEDISLEKPRAYEDYITWLKEQDFTPSEHFWRNKLEGFNKPTAISYLPTTDTQNGDREYAEIDIIIPEKETTTLQEMAKKNRLTLNAIVQGAWVLLLSRYSGEEDIVFGEVRANRRWEIEAQETIVGLFLNTLPLRVSVSPERSLVSWLEEIRQLQLTIRDHENFPLVDIQGYSGVAPGIALFDSVYVYDNYDLNNIMSSQGREWSNREFRCTVDNGYPLTLTVFAESKIRLMLAFDQQRFTDEAINRMLGHLKTLLVSIAREPNRTLAELPLLTEPERQQILVDWNETQVDYPQDRLIHQIFEDQAVKTPDAIAVVFENERLTYRELNNRANQLARYLQSIGIGPESLVGIAMERSLEMIIGLYGTLKSGGAYLPLDPDYPTDRVTYMIEEADVPVILTQKYLQDKIPKTKAKIVCLDADWEKLIAGQSIESAVSQVALQNLAYTIYTSGSTGNPKGVMNTHAGILNRLLWMQDTYKLTTSDIVLQKTPFSFDVSVWEFFWPLMFGARLAVARPGGHRDSDYLVRTIIKEKITTIHFVPSMLQIFLMAGDVEKCVSLRQVICSGEAMSLELQNRFFNKLDSRLHNLYGPTEAAVDVTYWECRPDTDLKTVSIGRPVANTQIYILDNNMQPVPVGIPGELFIGGIQVARGYLNRHELTAEKFIPDLFNRNPKTRLYRTGDLARYLPDGNIEYLGRLDFQVKIRGNRIELGEIEVLLGQHPSVRQAVVLAREDVPGDQRLVAYVTADREQEIPAAELRDYVMRKLPDFMVPSHFITLKELPLTPSQKIDRKALPAPDKLITRPAVSYVPPADRLQQAIAEIWQEVLGVSEVGINDNFFELGGHSLLIVKVYYRLRNIIDCELSITDMFRLPTISALTEYLSRGSVSGDNKGIDKVTAQAQARKIAIMRRRKMRRNIK